MRGGKATNKATFDDVMGAWVERMHAFNAEVATDPFERGLTQEEHDHAARIRHLPSPGRYVPREQYLAPRED